MRVVLSTYGSRGDVEPVVGLAVRLRECGARVRVCAPPDEEFARLLAGRGVPFFPAGPSVRAMLTGPPPPLAELPGRVTGLMAAQSQAVDTAGDGGCDAVVATGLFPAVVGARAAADRLGVRYEHVSFQPTVLPSPHHPPHPLPGLPLPPDVTDNRTLWELDARNVDAVFGAATAAHRGSLGLPPVDDVRGHVLADRPWLATDPVLAPWLRPAELDVVQTGAWVLPDERPLPPDLVAFLDADGPPVFVGFGSMPMRSPRDVARTAVEAVRAHGRRIVVSGGWAGLGAVDDRGDCLVVGEVNQQALFRRVAAVVHHGGAGTTTTAARAGAPQVVVPQVVDQPYWAGRVAALGIGVAHAGPTPTVASLAAALEAVLTPRVRSRASAVASRMRADGAAVAARLLLQG